MKSYIVRELVRKSEFKKKKKKKKKDRLNPIQLFIPLRAHTRSEYTVLYHHHFNYSRNISLQKRLIV